ncbi:hypothetical protein [Geoalkalibacter halelectricus]|uniref:Uncharacterized protein n=1 Tax=Geoalkalibacter halelectricus TaxID=2847045 RepID=A0ABY5ZL36_9BACT|nr:hypothetical protein [Geoalkalibacter halelectricus]MDO3377114.1 hypothetical protein [Geoalkalibacter halelectricus]UWZ79773.1 hypothetical protein L9S41_19160 [Geoalkalibacter halelectricus]
MIHTFIPLPTRNSEEPQFLGQIVATNPSDADFIAYDLWLQRKAMLLLFDREGLSGLGKGFWPARASLLYYLDLKRGLTDKQKKFILTSFTATQESENISLLDDLREYGNKSWQDWLTDTEAAPILELAPMFGQGGGGNKVESLHGYAASRSAGPA